MSRNTALEALQGASERLRHLFGLHL